MNGNFRRGGRTKEAIDASGYINALARLGAIMIKSLPQAFSRHVIAIGLPALITPVAWRDAELEL